MNLHSFKAKYFKYRESPLSTFTFPKTFPDLIKSFKKKIQNLR